MASIWIAAVLGAEIGCGLWQMGLVGMLLTLVTLSGVKRIRRWFLIWSGRKQEAQQLELEELAELESEEGD